MTEAQAEAIRKNSMEALNVHGLPAVDGLPLADSRGEIERRPAEEIARRLMGLHATVAWCCAPEELAPSPTLVEYIDSNELFEALTHPERKIVNSDRTEAAAYREQVGWYTENIWTLAWTLGFEMTPGIDGMPIKNEVGPPLTRDFLEVFDVDVDGLVSKRGLRPLDDIVALEDLFYCAHNAARSLAKENKEMRFPCGVIQERRHALTWCLSPGAAWDDIDLST